MIKGLVSCIIPTYKRNDTLPRAIDSILNQTYENLEVLVVDDNNQGDFYSEQVQKIIKNRYANDYRVKYISQERHINGAVARNLGIKLSSGEFIALLDDDDEWMNRKLEKQVQFLKENNNYSGVSCLCLIAKNGNDISKTKRYNIDNLQYKVLTRQVGIATPTFLCRKRTILESKGFDPNLSRHQDLQMFVDFLEKGNIGLIDEYLVRIHVDSDINRPNTERIIEVKEAYFNSIKSIIKKYNDKQVQRIFNAHYFEIVYCAFKEKKYLTMFRYLLKIGFSFKAYIDVYRRYKSR